MKKNIHIILSFILTGLLLSCNGQQKSMNENINLNEGTETAVFAAGCFWCVEAIFQELKGVYQIESGYSGGTLVNPTYKEICTGNTGHAEVVKISFDPEEISYEFLLSV
ncbi:MAG: peptide-methionine (S)-S-oxide reductase, partial [Bacteroidetes bacterium]|nr:peptide-methionine (S)-S-oxide reductase [Bacteroidota bacterium]